MESLILDIIMIGLLAAVIGYTWMLQADIKALRRSKMDVGPAIDGLRESLMRAQKTLNGYSTITTDQLTKLEESLVKASTLRDDLAFLMEHGENTANRIDHVLETARGTLHQAQTAAATPGSNVTPMTPPKPVKQAVPKMAAPTPKKARAAFGNLR